MIKKLVITEGMCSDDTMIIKFGNGIPADKLEEIRKRGEWLYNRDYNSEVFYNWLMCEIAYISGNDYEIENEFETEEWNF